MSNNSRLVILFIALIGIAGLSFFIFSEGNVDQQTNIQSEAEIETTTTISINSTTSTSTPTTLMETTTTTSTTSTSTTTTTTIPPNQTAIFATQEEINNSKKISYDYLQSGCKKDEPNNTDEEWIKPLEVFTYDENKINFNLKIESTLQLKVDCIGKLIASILNDSRGWIKVTEKEFQLVDNVESEFEFIFASPEKTDELCYPLETNGIYSCRNEQQIIINFFRWVNGAIDFGSDLETYRLYLINHEVGHILEWGHVGCPKEGALAPVMMQQSKSTMGCEPYGWPIYEILEKEFGINTYSYLPEIDN
ncbi:DUF3152 domain-containing protein [Acidimicrobiaceae bacterium]|nr:DUF3152 domain-containing protein [Acidimicrobiaceae bacterium]